MSEIKYEVRYVESEKKTYLDMFIGGELRMSIKFDDILKEIDKKNAELEAKK